MKKLLTLILVLSIALLALGCSGDSKKEDDSSVDQTEKVEKTKESEKAEETETEEASAETEENEKSEDEKLVFQYFATSMTVEWIQQIEEALKELGEENNFELLSADANRDIDQQLSQIDTAIQQDIDGAFVFIVDEGSAEAVVEKFNDAGIPIIGETLKLEDKDGNPIAPVVELNAEGVGAECGKWVSENHQEVNVDLSDQEKVGFIANTNSKYQSDLNRVTGFESTFFESFPDIPENQRFLADCASEATSTDNTEASYNQVLTILSTNPNIEKWVIFSSVDSYGMGAVRAVEAMELVENTIVVTPGGELAVKEWANDSGECWRAACYYNAMDFGEALVDGMLQIVREGKDPKDIYPEHKEEGDDYAFFKVVGNMVTPETYEEYINK
jgi:L-arabinose transport system substrate-binding protein